MPAAKLQPFQCFCDSCVISGGCDATGALLGRSIPGNQHVAHLRRAQMDTTNRTIAQTIPQPPISFSNSAQDHSSTLFIPTLAYDAPSIHSRSRPLPAFGDSLQKSSCLEDVAEFDHTTNGPDHRGAENLMLNPISDDRFLTIEEPLGSPDDDPAQPLPLHPLSIPTFTLKCRCGMHGDGHVLYSTEQGELIQCEDCHNWSHIACQKNGRISRFGANAPFECDFCNIRVGGQSLNIKNPTKAAKRRMMESRTNSKKPLNDRLWSGRGVLVRHGDFWYPARLIQRQSHTSWTVQWWRGCHFAKNGILPGTITEVDQVDIVDSLWNDRKARRMIQLGHWTHSWETPTSEDIFADPSSIPYTQAVHDALAGSETILMQLILDPDHADVRQVPAKRWLDATKKNLYKGAVPYCGNLSLIERARIANWFEMHITKDPKQRHTWMGLLPLAHAITLFITTIVKAEDTRTKNIIKAKSQEELTDQDITNLQELTDEQVMDMAWNLQFTATPSVLFDVDVDRDCLKVLEEEMFEKSERAGIAGNHQWGLDVGDHQQFNIYASVPYSWDTGERSGDENEILPGPNFKTIERPPVPVETRARPKPKLKQRRQIS